MRRTVLLLTAMGVALILGSGVALGAVLAGTQGNDTFNGTRQSDDLSGLGGNDDIFGLGGNDEVYGGTGRDDLRGNAGGDQLYGGSGTDVLVGGDGNDFINSADQTADAVNCGAGADTYVTDGRDAISSNCENNVGD